LNTKYIPESAIEAVAKHINERSNKPYSIPVIGIESNCETPQIFEIIPFDQIDASERRFYAIDGSYNSQQFYNGLAIGVYDAGYICFQKGKQVRVNNLDEPLILGKSYFPENILFTKDEHFEVMYDELLTLEPVSRLLDFFEAGPEEVFSFKKEVICSNLSTLLSFCQEVLEWSLVLEIANLSDTKPGDFILRDGTLRSNQIKQKYLVKLGKFVKNKNLILVSVTKNSPIKMELSYSFKQIDSYLQDKLKPTYPFKEKNPHRQKLCCWFEVPDAVLMNAYGGDRTTNMFAKKDIVGGRGFGLFTAARLDYVEKLQNYDWLIVDLNIFDAIPGIEEKNFARDRTKMNEIFLELTRLTQEHYILGYPYPLVEVHNFVTLKRDFKDEIIKRVKLSLYQDQHMDNIEIENLFLDIHDKF